MKIKSIAFLAFLTIATFGGCEEKGTISKNVVAKTKTSVQNKQEEQVMKFNLTTSTGKNIDILAAKSGWQFKGLDQKVVLLDFFGTWCPPCKAEIPHLNNIREDMKDKFEVIGIDIGSRRGEVTPSDELASFIKEFKIKYPITTSGDNRKLYGALGELNPNGSIPFMILFDKKGVIVQYYVGMQREGILRGDIDKALKR